MVEGVLKGMRNSTNDFFAPWRGVKAEDPVSFWVGWIALGACALAFLAERFLF